MGLREQIRRLKMKIRLAWQVWRSISAQGSEGLDEVDETEPDFFEDEEASQRAEIIENVEQELESDFNSLVRTLRGKNGNKKTKAD